MIKTWVVAYSKFIIYLCNFLVRTLQFFSKRIQFSLPIKSWKNHPQKLLRKTQIHFPYCPELPKRPKQKNSCSKMWLIDQLYIELGLNEFLLLLCLVLLLVQCNVLVQSCTTPTDKGSQLCFRDSFESNSLWILNQFQVVSVLHCKTTFYLTK